jgi:hypothetical protein
MSFLDQLLLNIKNVQSQGSLQQPSLPAINFLSGFGVAVNTANGSYDITNTGGGGNAGQTNITLANGLNSNIATAGLTVLRIGGPTAAFAVGGFIPTGGWTGGQELAVINTTTQPLTIVHEDTSTSTVNRINTQSGVPVVLPTRQSTAFFKYDATAQRLVLLNIGLQYPRSVDVRDFGAVLDGVTDDSGALNTAIAVAASGGQVFIPSGTVLLAKSPIVMDYSVNGAIGVTLRSTSFGAGVNGPQATVRAGFASRAGTSANITALSLDPNGSGFDRIVTLTGLSGMLSTDKGSQLQIGNTGTAGNAGTFTIVTVHSATSVDVYNYNTVSLTNPATAAVAPDGNNGSITWSVLPPLVQLRTYGCLFEGINFDGNVTAGTVFDSTYPATGAINSNHHWSRCTIQDAPYLVTIGDFGPLATYPPDCEFYHFEKCYFVNNSGAGLVGIWIPNSTGQSKKHEIDRCSFAVDGGSMQYWIRTDSGSFNTVGTSFEGAASSALLLGAVTDTINIVNSDVEGCNRFLQTAGASTTRWNVNILQGRFGITNGTLAGDGQYIQYSLGGGLNLQGCDFSQGVAGIGRFSIGIYGAAISAIKAVMQNCYFPTTGSAVATPYASAGGIGWYSVGCTAFDGTTLTVIPDGVNQDTYNGGGIVYPAGFQVPALSLPEASVVVANGTNNDVGVPSTVYSIQTTNWQISGPTGAFSITGIRGGTLPLVKEIFYEGGQTFTLSHQNTGSAASNRIISPTGADLVGVTYVRLLYNMTLSRWLVIASNVSLVPPVTSVTLGGDVTGPSGSNDVASLSGAGGTTAAIPLRSGAYINPTAGQTIVRIGTTPLIATTGTSGNTILGLAGDLTVSIAANATTLGLFDSTNGVTLGSTGGATTASINAASGDYIGLGVHPAGTGYVRLPNTGAIKARNAANSADLNLISTDSSNNILIGDGSIAGIAEINTSLGGLLQMAGTTVADYSTALGFAIAGSLVGGSRATSAPLKLGLSGTQVTATSGTVTLTAAQTQCPAIQVNSTLTGNLTIDFGGVTGWWQLDLSAFTQTPPYTLTLKNGSATSVNGSEVSFPTLVGVLCTSTSRIATGFIG